MFCPGCGNEVKEGEIFCGNCGIRQSWERDADNITEENAVKDIGNEKESKNLGSEESQNDGSNSESIENPRVTKNSENIEVDETMKADEAVKLQETEAETKPQSESSVEKKISDNTEKTAEEKSAETFTINKKVIKKALVGLAGIVVVIFILVRYFDTRDINQVKNSVLNDYDYGISIGKALHKWFGGTEEWDSFSENGVTYITARGVTNYTLTHKSQEQIFLFHRVNDDYFAFDGAFDSDGDYLYMGDGSVNWLDLGDVLVYGAYELTLKAAFGDAESLKSFTGSN